MNKNKKYVIFFLLFTAIIPSCELVNDCKTCKLITEENGNRTEGPGILYCGDKLEEKENSTPVTIGNTTTYWECK